MHDNHSTDDLLTLAGSVGLRCSSHILAMTSPVLARLLVAATDRTPNEVRISLPDDDGDALLLLCNILHLRNNALPSRLPADLLYKVAMLADKYQCATAAGRATMGWFDHLLHIPTGTAHHDTLWMVQAAYALDEPVAFARFTERWVLSEGMGSTISFATVPEIDKTGRKLAVELHNRRQALISTVRTDVDLMVNPCSVAYSKSSEHYIDYMPEMTPDPDEETGRIVGSLCYVDSQASNTFLGALRDNGIWPSTVWPDTLGQVIDKVKGFGVPRYDDCDKCEFCDDVKAKFGMAINLVKGLHRERLWGLCLDCFKAGGVLVGECRYEHSKPGQQT